MPWSLTLSFLTYRMGVQAFNLPVVKMFHIYFERYLNPEQIPPLPLLSLSLSLTHTHTHTHIHTHMDSCQVTDLELCSVVYVLYFSLEWLLKLKKFSDKTVERSVQYGKETYISNGKAAFISCE